MSKAVVFRTRGTLADANYELAALQERHGYIVLSVSCQRVLVEPERRKYEGEVVEEWTICCQKN
jgi:hypothetical protein